MIEQTLAINRWTLPLVLLASCLLFYSSVWPFNRQDGIFQGLDLREYTYPYFDFIVREVRTHRELPFWNPYELAGFSIVGAGEVNLFYPPNWLMFVLEPRQAVALNVILHGFIGMWGLAQLARRLGSSRLGALLAGLLWCGSGLIGARVWAGHYTILLPLGWMPWVLAEYVRSLRQGTWQSGLGGALAMGLVLLSGHPQIGLITGVSVLAIAGFELINQPSWADLKRVACPLVMIGALGALLAMIALLPVVETTLASERKSNHRQRLEFANAYSMPANQLLTFVFPQMIGGPKGFAGSPNFEELFAYSGLLSLLAVIVLLAYPNREIWLLVVLTSVGILLSLAIDGGLLRLLVQLFPPLGMFRAAGRWLILPQIALACLAALLITFLQTASHAKRNYALRPVLRFIPKVSLVCFGLALVLSWAKGIQVEVIGKSIAVNVPGTNPIWNAARIAAKTGLFLLFFQLVLLGVQRLKSGGQRVLVVLMTVAVLDVWSVSLPLLNTGPLNTYAPFWHQLTSVLPPSETGYQRLIVSRAAYRTYLGATGKGYYDVDGYEQLVSDAYTKWVARSDLLSPRNRLLGVGYIVRSTPYPDPLLDPEDGLLDLVANPPGQSLYVYKIRQPVPRAFLATGVSVEADNARVREYFSDQLGADLGMVWVKQPPPCLQPSYKGGQAEIVEYRPNRVEIQTWSDGPGLLFLSDRYATGWRATVNGTTSKIFRANTEFRAVCVPAGESRVVFSYRPISLYIGGVISALSWLGTGIALLVLHLRLGWPTVRWLT